MSYEKIYSAGQKKKSAKPVDQDSTRDYVLWNFCWLFLLKEDSLIVNCSSQDVNLPAAEAWSIEVLGISKNTNQ